MKRLRGLVHWSSLMWWPPRRPNFPKQHQGFYTDRADAFKKAVGQKHFFSNDRSWPVAAVWLETDQCTGELIVFSVLRNGSVMFILVINRNARDVSMKISRPHFETAEQLAHVDQPAGNQMAHAIERLPLSIDAKQL
jgi:hypothetical protein